MGKGSKIFLKLQYSNIPTFHFPLMFYVILKNKRRFHKRIKSPLVITKEGFDSTLNRTIIPESFFPETSFSSKSL